MPTDQRVGFDDHKGIPPIEEASELSQRITNGVGGPPRFYFALDIQGELFAQKQILGRESCWGTEAQAKEP